MNKFNNIVIWPTNRCNLECKYCYAKCDNYLEDMSIKTFINASKYFEDKVSIQFAGGEPIINFHLIKEIHKYINQKQINAKMNLQTNATLIDREVARDIKKMKLNVGVSLDGPLKINEYTRGGTTKTIEGIKNLAKENIITNLNMVVTEETIVGLSELVDLAFYLGNIHGIGLDLLRKTGEYNKNTNMIKEVSENSLRNNLILAYERTQYLYNLTGRSIVLRDIEEAKLRLKYKDINSCYCYAAMGKSLVVLPNGDCYPCGSLIGYEKYYMGNVNRNSITFKKIAYKTDNKCNQCKYVNSCPKGCPSRLIINNKNESELNTDCILRKTAFEISEKIINC